MRSRSILDRLALCVTLPMAQTPDVAGRLGMILDPTRSRRALTRRAITAGFIGAACLAAFVATAQIQPHTAAGGATSPQTELQPPMGQTPSMNQTPWSSVTNLVYWGPGKTHRCVTRVAPSVSGTHPDPPVGAVLASGPGHLAHVSVKVWKPNKSNILTVSYDYTPVKTDYVHADVIHLLTKAGAVAAVITYKSGRPK